MYHWRWSNGEPYYKTAREVKSKEQDQNKNQNQGEDQEQQLDYEIGFDSQQNAINQSLAETGFNDMDMMDITNSMFSRSQNETNNRREHLDNKMASREALFQRGVNPFINQTSYVNDVVVRDMFLKPICTTHDKVKMDNDNKNKNNNNNNNNNSNNNNNNYNYNNDEI